MADKKESALSAASDAAYVRGIDANGNSIQISKADLAVVMAGVLGNILISQPKTLSGTTIDDVSLTSGSYIFSGAQSNGLSNYSGVLLVLGTYSETQIRLLISKDVMAYKRSDSNWLKVTAVSIEQ